MKENNSGEMDYTACEEVEYKRIDDKNYKKYLKLNIAAFSWASPGAMGSVGEVIIITEDETRYYTNYADGTIEMDNLLRVLHISEEPIWDEKINKKFTWVQLGHGNLLFVKNKYAEDMKYLIEEIAPYQLYTSLWDYIQNQLYRCWEDYLQIVMHEHTHAHMLLVLGYRLYTGHGISKNKKRGAKKLGIEYIMEAAEYGYPPAQRMLAKIENK